MKNFLIFFCNFREGDLISHSIINLVDKPNLSQIKFVKLQFRKILSYAVLNIDSK